MCSDQRRLPINTAGKLPWVRNDITYHFIGFGNIRQSIFGCFCILCHKNNEPVGFVYDFEINIMNFVRKARKGFAIVWEKWYNEYTCM